MGIITALLIGSIVSAVASLAGAGVNYASTAKASQANIDMQNQVNAQNQFNIEHAHEMEMADLKRAGLNPILTATGGQGAPVSMLQAPRATAPQMDMSGIGTAMSGIQHALTMQMMMQMRGDIASERNATLASIAKGHDAQSAANAALRASMAVQKGQSLINSAKGWESPLKGMSQQQRMRFLKMAHTNLWK